MAGQELGAPHLLDGDSKTIPWVEHLWRWGFLSGISAQCLTYALAQTLVTAPAARFLRELRVNGTAYYNYDALYNYDEMVAGQPPPRAPLPAGVDEHWELFELIGAPWLSNLRVFQVGGGDDEPQEDGRWNCRTYAPGVEHVIAGMDRVEELHLLCKNYDAGRLFALPNLARLRVLRVITCREAAALRGPGRFTPTRSTCWRPTARWAT